MKKCPFCAEGIQDEAIVCKHCGRELDAEAVGKVGKKKSWLEKAAEKAEQQRKDNPQKTFDDQLKDLYRHPFKALGQMAVGIGCFVVLVVVIFGVGGWLYDASQGTAKPAVEVTGQKAFIICQHFVEAKLKSPSSADFPFSDYQSAKRGPTKFLIKSYVDSQNSFGAQVRTTWNCVIQHRSGDWANPNNWTLVDLQFE